MTHTHVCVWLDHREAKVFGIGLEAADEATVREPGPHQHIHRKADQVGQGKDPPDAHFLGEIADALGEPKAILITGPGLAKDELASYLRQHRPALAAAIHGVDPMDHPTDREIVASARHFFRADDRMHG